MRLEPLGGNGRLGIELGDILHALGQHFHVVVHGFAEIVNDLIVEIAAHHDTCVVADDFDGLGAGGNGLVNAGVDQEGDGADRFTHFVQRFLAHTEQDDVGGAFDLHDDRGDFADGEGEHVKVIVRDQIRAARIGGVLDRAAPFFERFAVVDAESGLENVLDDEFGSRARLQRGKTEGELLVDQIVDGLDAVLLGKVLAGDEVGVLSVQVGKELALSLFVLNVPRSVPF